MRGFKASRRQHANPNNSRNTRRLHVMQSHVIYVYLLFISPSVLPASLMAAPCFGCTHFSVLVPTDYFEVSKIAWTLFVIPLWRTKRLSLMDMDVKLKSNSILTCCRDRGFASAVQALLCTRVTKLLLPAHEPTDAEATVPGAPLFLRRNDLSLQLKT